MLLAKKTWQNASAFIESHENGTITVYCKFYDENGRGHFGNRTEVLGKLEGYPEVPQEIIKNVEIKSFMNRLRKIFAPKKVKYQTIVLNQNEIEKAERDVKLFMKKFLSKNNEELTQFFNEIWKKAKENNSWLTYEL